MADKLEEYQAACAPLPDRHRLWPLYGAGLENLGRAGRPIVTPMPTYGPGELLVRHDACGLCFSDIKVIKQGPEHPRIRRDMRSQPVTLGHEVAMTVVGVGDNLRGQYHPGDRFIVQPDILVGGVGYTYGYEIQGGLSQYGIIDQRILDGDEGNYLIPVQRDVGYAEAALAEPWACVNAAYDLTYRTGLKAGGTTWIVGAPQGKNAGTQYTIGAGFSESSHPKRLLLTKLPAEFADWLKDRARTVGVEVVEQPSVTAHPPSEMVDDIVLLGADPDLVEAVSPALADDGILALIANRPMPRPVAVDVGRIHYSRWLYVGGQGPDIVEAYRRVPVRSALKPGGRVWFIGAGGPMGHMHVQRALQVAERPATIVCTEVGKLRLDNLGRAFSAEAQAKGVEWLCLNPTREEEYASAMARFRREGFDVIVVLAPIPALIEDAATYLAPRGVMNIFAGVARGTLARLDLSGVYLKDTRLIGHSGSTISDLRLTLSQVEAGQLSPNRSVAAIGSLSAARGGLQSVLDADFPGKVVIFPNIREMPLTSLPDLKNALPSVHARLRDGREWTVAAEQEFLRLMLDV